MGGFVVYESRLELARLLLADFDQDVRGIYAQPFLLVARVNGRVRRHVPDFLLVSAVGTARLVNVKPAVRLRESSGPLRNPPCRCLIAHDHADDLRIAIAHSRENRRQSALLTEPRTLHKHRDQRRSARQSHLLTTAPGPARWRASAVGQGLRRRGR